MDRSPLHPLRLLPALLATQDQGRRHFESEIEQWLAAQSETAEGASTDAAHETPATAASTAADADHPADGTAGVPNAGETIPETGQ